MLDKEMNNEKEIDKPGMGLQSGVIRPGLEE